MSKYRDHRDQRRRRHHDEDGGFSGQTPEPSYFHRPPVIAAAPPIDAEVLWFNANKGFGFVKLADGTEAYMHVRALEASGGREVFEGTRLKIRVEETPRGHQVAQVLEIGDAVLKSSSCRGSGDVAVAGASPQPKTDGTVKWYDPQKGFGFIAPSNGDRDIFVHATALTRSGLNGLADGQKVLVECGQGKKGLEVWSISLA